MDFLKACQIISHVTFDISAKNSGIVFFIAELIVCCYFTKSLYLSEEQILCQLFIKIYIIGLSIVTRRGPCEFHKELVEDLLNQFFVDSSYGFRSFWT
jgi:hypothetical protein